MLYWTCHVWTTRVERGNVHFLRCQSPPGSQFQVGCWNFDSSEDDGLEPSGSDRHGAAAFSWTAAGIVGEKSADRSIKYVRRVEDK